MRRAETIIENALKRCLTCNTLKAFTEFSKHRGHFLGLASQCKSCKAQVDREYRARHVGKVKEYFKEYTKHNRPAINRNSRSYWLRNKEKYRVYVRNRRARLLQADGSFTLTEWNELKRKYNYSCAICGEREPFNQFRKFLTIDHVIPLSKNGTNHVSNIQPLCFNCNSIKKDKV